MDVTDFSQPLSEQPLSEQPPSGQALSDHPRVQQLIAQGAKSGQISYGLINDLLGDLQVDESEVEVLLEALEKRGIAIVDDPPEAATDAELDEDDPVGPPIVQGATRREAGAAAAAPGRRSRHPDLDEALASLEELLAATEAPAKSDGQDDAEEEVAPGVEDAYKQYLNQMGRVPLLSAEEEVRLARLARDGTPEEQIAAKQKLVESNLRLVVFMARRYVGRSNLPLLDIVQEGNIGLMRAVERFDPERGHRLSTYATWWIRQSINRAVGEQMRSMRLPAHLSDAIQKLNRLQREMAQSLGREPSRQELAEASGMTVVQVDEALRAGVQPLSLESPMGEESDMELGESLTDPDADTPITAFSRTELREELNRSLQGLSERERVIILKRFGMGDYAGNGPSSLEDIATEMKLSRERVRQLEIRALRKLRRRSRNAALGDFFQNEDEE